MRFLFLLPAILAVVLAGGLVAFRNAQMRQNGPSAVDYFAPIHFVTKQMEVETAAMKNTRAPEIEGTSELGKPVELAPKDAARPQFVLFIKDGCVCSIDAQPLFNSLARKFKDKVDFIGVIDVDRDKARDYAEQFTAAFPVVADAGLKVVHAYGAKSGLYSALIARNGHIAKMWPGYSVDILADMNRLLSDEAGIKETPFDPEYAPTKKAAGCAYATDWH